MAFIAVDSEASVVGGRANWALPKGLARFEGTIGLQGDAAVVGPDWTVRVGTRSRPLRLPTWLRYSCCQLWPDLTVRHFPLKVQGWSRWGRSTSRSARRARSALGWRRVATPASPSPAACGWAQQDPDAEKGHQNLTEGEPTRDARWTREGDASHTPSRRSHLPTGFP